MPAYQLAVGSLDPVSRMHVFRELSLSHFFSPLLNQIMAQSHHQNPPPTLGAGALLLHRTAITLISPLDPIILRAHIGISNPAPLGADVSLRTNCLPLLNVHRESIGVVGPRVRIRTGGSYPTSVLFSLAPSELPPPSLSPGPRRPWSGRLTPSRWNSLRAERPPRRRRLSSSMQ